MAVAVVPRQICHHCHFILDLVTQVALQGSGIGSMGRAGWVVGAAISQNSQYMGHGSWEGKLGRVGVWEHGNLVGKGRESKAQEPSRQRGKVGRSRGN